MAPKKFSRKFEIKIHQRDFSYSCKIFQGWERRGSGHLRKRLKVCRDMPPIKNPAPRISDFFFSWLSAWWKKIIMISGLYQNMDCEVVVVRTSAIFWPFLDRAMLILVNVSGNPSRPGTFSNACRSWKYSKGIVMTLQVISG